MSFSIECSSHIQLQSEEADKFLTFFDLPLDIIENILKYIPKDRKNLSLVCKSFYEMICRIYENKLSFSLCSAEDPDVSEDEAIEERNEILKMLRTPLLNCPLRRLRNLDLSRIDGTLDNSKEFWRMLKVQGNNLRTLKIAKKIKFEHLNEILSMTQYLTKLELHKLKIDPQDFPELDLSHLKALKSLSVDNCRNFRFQKVKMSPNQLNSLMYDFNFPFHDFSEDLYDFLQHQSELKVMIFSKSSTRQKTVTKNFLKNCRLEKLEWNVNEELSGSAKQIAEDILLSQTDLKDLTLLFHLWDDLLKKLVKKMCNLERFCGNFNEIGGHSFWKLMNLRKLKDLTVNYGDFNEYLTILEAENSKFQQKVDAGSSSAAKRQKVHESLKFHQLQALKLDGHETGPNNYKILAEILPKLKTLEISSIIDVNFNDILLNFPKIEELNISIFPQHPLTLDNSKMVKNENLKKLKLQIEIGYDLSNIQTLIQCYPNLTTLQISMCENATQSYENELEMIFTRYPYIEKVLINFSGFFFTSEAYIRQLMSLAPTISFVKFSGVLLSEHPDKYDPQTGGAQIISIDTNGYMRIDY